MTSIKTLPLLDGAKFIVVDEGLEATCVHNLIIGWLLELRAKNPGRTIDYLLFSNVPQYLRNRFESLSLDNVKIHDFFTTDVDEEPADTYKQLQNLDFDANSVIIVDCLSTLALSIGLSKACHFIEQLTRGKCQVICIYRRDFDPNNIPRIDTLGTSYVKLHRSDNTDSSINISYVAVIVHRKSGGGVIHQTELVRQDIETCIITSEKMSALAKLRLDNKFANETQEMPQASFRLEISQKEMEQRNNTSLPYTIAASPTYESKIIYQPDDNDDLDEEDPDDDLCF